MTWDLRSRSQQAGAVILMVAPVQSGQRGPRLPFHARVSEHDDAEGVVVRIQWRVGSREVTAGGTGRVSGDMGGWVLLYSV